MNALSSPPNPLADLFRNAYAEFVRLLAQVPPLPAAPAPPENGSAAPAPPLATRAALALKEKLVELANGLRMNTYQRRASADLGQADAVKFAFVAIVDEILLNEEWAGKAAWHDCLLEAVLFDSRLAGDRLFERIDASMKVRSPDCLEIAEVYLDCLNLGFRGKWRTQANGITRLATTRHALFFFVHQRWPNLAGAPSLNGESAPANLIRTEPHQRSLLEKAHWHLYVVLILAIPLLISVLYWQNIEGMLSPQLDPIAEKIKKL